ncbi:MAG TPA: type II toxin-antitoxin system VapC family toxin [Myxococcales bacterium]|nr:type II toxin-antitoxin system VapC family toxin [Myxococcales bacterium]
MKSIVVDASVAIKWFVPEIHAVEAARWLSSGHPLLAPELLFAEVSNIVWKKTIRAGLSEAEARSVRRALAKVPLLTISARELSEAALDLALALRCSVYDALYVALSIAEDALLVTADRKLYNLISGTPLKQSVCWVEDEPPLS